jgi:mitochondrial fission protein ELM1
LSATIMAMTTKSTPQRAAEGAAARERPYVVTLEPRPGTPASGRPPVRIFLGTQDEQWRAERIFFYSIEQVRDPARTYEVHVMKGLAGYVRKGWRTGFTNYRFAIPDYAGRTGKAIYNDVDQIYTADPALLFDLELGEHGYLAVSASDTSVMLLDCARMAEWWNLDTATRGTKGQLLGKVRAQRSLWGPLDPGWNARDMEFEAGRSMLLHYTAMHTQPWHPFPKDYAYRHHPLGEVWYRLERAADAEGYQVFTRQRPSAQFREIAAQYGRPPGDETGQLELPAAAAKLAGALDVQSVLRLELHTLGSLVQDGPTESPLPLWERDRVRGLAPAGTDASTAGRSSDGESEVAPRYRASPLTLSLSHKGRGDSVGRPCVDAVIAADLLQRLPGEDVPWLLEEMFGRAGRLVYVAVDCQEAAASVCVREPGWWRAQIAAAAARHPDVAWRLDAIGRNRQGQPTTVAYQSNLAGHKATPPRVWVLAGPRAGDRSQLLALADSLGWPYEVKELSYNAAHHLPNWLLGDSVVSLDRARSSALAPPWPDLIIDGGKRSVPAARWILARSGGQARWVHVGRPWAPMASFDLLVAAPQYRLPPRPNVMALAAPLHRITPQRLAEAAAHCQERWQELPRPWLALLVGGHSPPYLLDAAAARRLGEAASAAARAEGGSLLVTTSARTRPEAAAALFDSLSVGGHRHRWQAGATDNPYLAYLALADRFIVTGDSASMLAEACATGKPVAIFEVPRRPTLLGRLLAAIERLATGHGARKNYRGMPKQQDWLARSFDRLVERGLFMPLRDLRECHRELRARGLLHGLGDSAPQGRQEPIDDMQRVRARVRQLMTGDRRVE